MWAIIQYITERDKMRNKAIVQAEEDSFELNSKQKSWSTCH